MITRSWWHGGGGETLILAILLRALRDGRKGDPSGSGISRAVVTALVTTVIVTVIVIVMVQELVLSICAAARSTPALAIQLSLPWSIVVRLCQQYACTFQRFC